MALVPQTKSPNTIPRGEYYPPAPSPLLSRDGHRHPETDDRSIISQILYIDESHDDRPYDPTPISLKHILQAAEVILSYVSTPEIHSIVLVSLHICLSLHLVFLVIIITYMSDRGYASAY